MKKGIIYTSTYAYAYRQEKCAGGGGHIYRAVWVRVRNFLEDDMQYLTFCLEIAAHGSVSVGTTLGWGKYKRS